MGFFEGIATWFLERLLAWLFNLASNAIEKHEDQVREDKRRGEVNDKNVKAYEEAKTRADRIAAAQRLLNREP